jgi:RNA polymerase sigma-70 factor, ECF subfamily
LAALREERVMADKAELLVKPAFRIDPGGESWPAIFPGKKTRPWAQLYEGHLKIRPSAMPSSPNSSPVPREADAEDLRLLKRATGGDSAAFHELVDRHASRLFRLATSLVGNSADAEDVLQEAFAGAYRGLKGFESRSSVKTWLTRILVIQAAKSRRSRKPTESLEQAGSDATGTATGDAAASVDARLDLQAALQKMSAEFREVIVLRELEQMSYEEIAATLDIPRGTVESRLHRARAELREKLKAYLQ